MWGCLILAYKTEYLQSRHIDFYLKLTPLATISNPPLKQKNWVIFFIDLKWSMGIFRRIQEASMFNNHNIMVGLNNMLTTSDT